MYSISSPPGNFTYANLFPELDGGVYTVNVKDDRGCGISPFNVTVRAPYLIQNK